MQRQAIKSSQFTSVGYDPIVQTMEIEFNATGVYQYFAVPKEVFDGLLAAPSAGKYFNQNIKTKFAWKRIEIEKPFFERCDELDALIKKADQPPKLPPGQYTKLDAVGTTGCKASIETIHQK